MFAVYEDGVLWEGGFDSLDCAEFWAEMLSTRTNPAYVVILL